MKAVDPWDETPATFPIGYLSVLLELATLADEGGLTTACATDPCPECSAMQTAWSVIDRFTDPDDDEPADGA
jgi:hypothetical protein